MDISEMIAEMQEKLDRAWEIVRIVDSSRMADEVEILLERVDYLELENERLRNLVDELEV